MCGLINVQFAVKDGQVYVLEANPRASRTVPVRGQGDRRAAGHGGGAGDGGPDAGRAARGGAAAADAVGRVPVLDHVSVKEAVLPFDRFPGVDTLLGPEMRSTGEVMGIDITFGLAFAKSQMAAGTRLPDAGTVFLSLADRDKPAGLEVARAFAELGFSIAATLGTAGYLRVGRASRSTRWWPRWGRRAWPPTRSSSSPRARCSWSSTRRAASARGPTAQHIRTAAVAHKVPCLTTVAAARAAAAGIADARAHPLVVRPLQELHPARRGERREPRRARRAGRDLAARVGAVDAAQPDHDGVGDVGPRRRAGRLRRPGRPRRGRGQVALGRAVAGQPGAAGARGRRGHAQQRRPAGPGRGGLAGATTCPALAAAGRPGRRRASGAAAVADYAPGRRARGAAPPRRLGRCVARRGQRQLPQRRGPRRACSPTRPTATARGARRPPTCGLPRWAKLSPNVPDIVEIAAGALEGGADGADPGQHPARAGPRHRRRASPCSARAAAGSRAPPSTRWRSGPSASAGPPSPTRPIVGVGGVALGPRRGRAAAGRGRRRPGRHGHLPRPAGAVAGAARTGALVPGHDTTVADIRRAGARPVRATTRRQRRRTATASTRRRRHARRRTRMADSVRRPGRPRRSRAPGRCVPASTRRPSCCATWGLHRRRRRACAPSARPASRRSPAWSA